MDLKSLGVVVGCMTVVGGLSYLRAKSSGSLSEAIAPLSSFDPEETFVGERKALPMPALVPMPTMVSGVSSGVRPRGFSKSSEELMAADGSSVRVGRGLSLRDGSLEVSRDLGPARLGQDVFLL